MEVEITVRLHDGREPDKERSLTKRDIMPAPIVKDLKGPIATRLCATWSLASARPDIQSLGLSIPRRCAQSAARRMRG
jgi:hypothetical protein